MYVQVSSGIPSVLYLLGIVIPPTVVGRRVGTGGVGRVHRSLHRWVGGIISPLARSIWDCSEHVEIRKV